MRQASLCVLVVALVIGCSSREPEPTQEVDRNEPAFVGSSSCRECHERFYQLWEPSHHGRAMQVFSPALAREHWQPLGQQVVIGDVPYRFVLDGTQGFIEKLGPDGTTQERHEVLHALGGKNVYYLLTPRERGRLQVLPIAYDAHQQEWFDTTLSAMRHFVDGTDEVIEWTDPALTFNTSCHGCHVSQFAPNYDLETDSYHTTWLEPGINCETCHGPSREHVELFQDEDPDEKVPEDIRIVRLGPFTADQNNSLCSSCHAKLMPVAARFEPGGRYFDHFDLVTLEHQDFYPDGRDLGENYTLTQWMRSPCALSGQLDCIHCHTSSGRDRHAGEKANEACLPCHADRVENATDHTRHPADSTGNRCVSCHMPKTWFARMQRHDHSMLPPTPATTLAFGSPNACNICHTDRDAAWADEWVRRWRQRDFQAPVLARAKLLDEARKGDFSRLGEMLAAVSSGEHGAVYTTSLLRLVRNSRSEERWPALLAAIENPSPLVRGAAAEALGDHLTPETLPALLAATRDDFRLVRVRAAASLAGVPDEMLEAEDRASLRAALSELESSLMSRPDDATAHYNLGNLTLQTGRASEAAASFETAAKLRPDFMAPLVNASMAYSQLGRNGEAERVLRRALELDPSSAAAHLNLGLLLAEQGRTDEAAAALKAAFENDPTLAVAAYNLGVLLSEKQPAEALSWCARAAEAAPDEPKYAYTLAFFQRQGGDVPAAVRTLRELIERHPAYPDAYFLLGAIYEEQGQRAEARALYTRGREHLPPQAQPMLATRLRALEG